MRERERVQGSSSNKQIMCVTYIKGTVGAWNTALWPECIDTLETCDGGHCAGGANERKQHEGRRCHGAANSYSRIK